MSMAMPFSQVPLQEADAHGAALFQPYKVRDIVARNRAVISPMQQYPAADGAANERHLVHLARFALSGN
jgi:anthraniloyl-CoA monooxygenase